MSKTIKVGTVFPVPVNQKHIDASVPCDKGNCMLSLAGYDLLVNKYGNNVSRLKSTNHGMTFDINGYRVLLVFDHQTGHRIYQYDQIYKKTKSMQRAKASVKPFKAKLMVESCQKIPTYPPMSEEKKAALAELRKKKPSRNGGTGLHTNHRRQLSE